MERTALVPTSVAPRAGQTVRVITDLVTFKALATDTGGAYSLFETLTQPGQGTPPHRQFREEESFYVVEGRYSFLIGDRTVELEAGGFAFVPRETVHAFTNIGATPGRMLILVTPGGIHEEFFKEVGEPSDVPPAGPPDFARIVAAAAKHGMEILPPQA